MFTLLLLCIVMTIILVALYWLMHVRTISDMGELFAHMAKYEVGVVAATLYRTDKGRYANVYKLEPDPKTPDDPPKFSLRLEHMPVSGSGDLINLDDQHGQVDHDGNIIGYTDINFEDRASKTPPHKCGEPSIRGEFKAGLNPMHDIHYHAHFFAGSAYLGDDTVKHVRLRYNCDAEGGYRIEACHDHMHLDHTTMKCVPFDECAVKNGRYGVGDTYRDVRDPTHFWQCSADHKAELRQCAAGHVYSRQLNFCVGVEDHRL